MATVSSSSSADCTGALQSYMMRVARQEESGSKRDRNEGLLRARVDTRIDRRHYLNKLHRFFVYARTLRFDDALSFYFSYMNNVNRVIVERPNSEYDRNKINAHVVEVSGVSVMRIVLNCAHFEKLARVIDSLPNDFFSDLDIGVDVSNSEDGPAVSSSDTRKYRQYGDDDADDDDESTTSSSDSETSDKPKPMPGMAGVGLAWFRRIDGVRIKPEEVPSYDRERLLVLVAHLIEVRTRGDLLAAFPAYVTVSAILTGDRSIVDPFVVEVRERNERALIQDRLLSSTVMV